MKQVDPIPLQHIAFIPDGNRRWAKIHGVKNERKIYQKGSETMVEVVEAAFRAGIRYVSFWASSYNNLVSRPKDFVGGLEDIYVQKFEQLATHPMVHENKIKVEAPGDWRESLRPNTVAAIEKALEATSHYKDGRLVVLLGYDGSRERGAAVQSLLKSNEPAPSSVNEARELLRKHSWTGYLPNVDLIIRTGAWEDPHISAGFLGLLSDEAQLAFPEVLWPDLNAVALQKIILDYSQRERRMGA